MFRIKRIAIFVLVAILSIASWPVPTSAQRISNAEYARRSRKEQKRQQKMYRKGTKKQQKAMNKYAKAQAKANRKANRRAR